MAGNVKVGGGVSQILGQSNVGSVDPDAFAPQAHGLSNNAQGAFPDGAALSLQASTAVAAGEQYQSQTADQYGFGGNAGGDTEVLNSGNTGPMVG